MANTYKLISSNVLSTSTTSISFSSIPQTYTDLVIRTNIRTDNTGSGNGFSVYLNGSTTSASRTIIYGDGSTAATLRSSTAPGGLVNGTTETANTFAGTEVYIPNYGGSTYKPVSTLSVMENNANFAYISAGIGLWSNTSAVTSITLTSGVGNFIATSSFYLYGIKNS
jgi:hypothetical protein